MCESPTHYLILNSLAYARGRVILRSYFLILLFAYYSYISLYSHLFLTSTVILLLCDHRVRIFQQCFVDADRYIRILDFCCLVLPTLKWPPSIRPLGCQSYVMTRTFCVKRVEERYVIQLLFVKNVKIGRMSFVSYVYVINVPYF